MVIAIVTINSVCPRVLTHAAFCKLIAVNQPIEPARDVMPINIDAGKFLTISAICRYSKITIHSRHNTVCRVTIKTKTVAALTTPSIPNESDASRIHREARAKSRPAPTPNFILLLLARSAQLTRQLLATRTPATPRKTDKYPSKFSAAEKKSDPITAVNIASVSARAVPTAIFLM